MARAHLITLRVFAVLTCLGLVHPTERARAYDVRVDSDTLFRAYEVQPSDATASWSRRRFSQRLSLHVSWPLVDGDADPLARALSPRVAVFVDMRFDRELGDTCLVQAADRCFVVTDGEVRSRYEPLAEDGRLSVPAGYVEADNLPLTARVRAGRQVFWDPIGFARIDGARVEAEPWTFVSVAGAFGHLVRQTSVGGRDAFAPPGIARLDLPQDVIAQSAQVDSPMAATLAGASLYVGERASLRVGGHYRHVWDGSGLLQREAAVSAESQPLSPLRADMHAVFDARDAALVDGQAELSALTGPVRVTLRGRRQVPRFDYGSVWAYFAVAPSWQGSLGADLLEQEGFTVGAEVRARRMDVVDEPDDDLGVFGHAALTAGRVGLDLSAFGWTGSLGASGGADLGTRYRAHRRLQLFAHAFAYRVQGVSAGLRPSITWGELAGAEYSIATGLRGSLELSHGHTLDVGHRITLLAWLHMGAFR